MAKMAGGAVNVLSSVRQQIQDEIKARIDDMAARMDLVPREDMYRLEAMVKKLSARIDALEGKKAPTPKTKTAPVKKKKK